MVDLKKTRRGGFYFKDGLAYLSTTEILKIIAKPAIAYWYGQEVFYAMVKDPSLGEKEALAAPYKASRSAMNRGTTIHSVVEAFKNTKEEIETIPEDIRGYASAFYEFMETHNPEMIEQEKSLFDEVDMTAGTLDMYAKIGDLFHIIDIKTGKDIYDEVALQMSNYAYMMRLAGKRVDRISCLLLETGEDKRPTGNYKFQVQTENREAFLAAKKLYEWQNQGKILKVGYVGREVKEMLGELEGELEGKLETK